MNKHHPYNNIIERKLEQLPVADADHLWEDMHSILDEKMPEKKERRRFILWLFKGWGLLVLMIACFFLGGSSVLLLSKTQNSTVTLNKLDNPSKSDKLIKDDAVKILQGHEKNTVIDSEQNQENTNTISTTLFSTNDAGDKGGYKTSTSVTSVNHVNNLINYDAKAPKVITKSDRSKKYTAEYQIDETIEIISKTRSDFHISPVGLKSIHQDFPISTNHNKKIDSLIKMADFLNSNIKTNPMSNNEKGLYTGVIAGIDLSSIRLRSTRAGATKGFVIGYAFNKKWSIESGLLWDTKRVFDNGSHFNPPGYTPTNGITITAVNGKSRLYELPVNVKYTIKSGRHNFFATTGLSSYFMRSENYDYEYTQNNQPGGHNYLNYKNGTKDWFSVINFSMGYARKIGNAGSIRIEPYLKLPIKNIGTGNMPIMSTGLNVGITKKIR